MRSREDGDQARIDVASEELDPVKDDLKMCDWVLKRKRNNTT
jgi:hypothetical protein